MSASAPSQPKFLPQGEKIFERERRGPLRCLSPLLSILERWTANAQVQCSAVPSEAFSHRQPILALIQPVRIFRLFEGGNERLERLSRMADLDAPPSLCLGKLF